MAGLLLGGIGVARLEAQRGGGGRASQDRLGNAAPPPGNPSGTATSGPTQTAPPSPGYVPPSPYQTQQNQPVRRPSPAVVTPQSTQQNQNKPATPPGSRVAAVTTPAVTTGIPARPITPAPNGVMPAQTGGFIGPQLPPPPPPLPPEKQPPSPPKVNFQDGLLTIESTNARLGDILSSVRSKAGIQFEGMDSGVERVAAKLGPAPADEVLSSLLQGSRFDYVILSHSGDPHNVDRVLLSARGTAPPMNGTAAPTKPQPSEEEAEEAATEEQTQPPPELPPDGQAQVPQPPPQSLTPASIPSGVPTPEQMLERIKEQQQKNQQQGPMPNATAPVKRQLPQ